MTKFCPLESNYMFNITMYLQMHPVLTKEGAKWHFICQRITLFSFKKDCSKNYLR